MNKRMERVKSADTNNKKAQQDISKATNGEKS
jgi:hypothetical protein